VYSQSSPDPLISLINYYTENGTLRAYYCRLAVTEAHITVDWQ